MIWRVPALILIGLASGIVGLWVADRQPPTAQTQMRELLTPVVPAGGALLIRYHLQRFKLCRTTVERTITDATGIRYVLDPLSFSSLPAHVGPESYTTKVVIPKDVNPGNARYRSMATYVCNPIHSLFWPVTSQVTEVDFRVVEPESPSLWRPTPTQSVP